MLRRLLGEDVHFLVRTGRAAEALTRYEEAGRLVIADVVALSLTFDHRVVDGAPAAAFLTSLCEMVETPLGWLYG